MGISLNSLVAGRLELTSEFMKHLPNKMTKKESVIMVAKITSIASLLLASATSVMAGGSNLIIPDSPKWKEECATSCHIGYPPPLMTEENWYQLMTRLDRHFGVNVALDPKDNKEILEFLLNNSGLDLGGKSSMTGLRITDTPWFVFEHRYISNVWHEPAIKSRANCEVCHVNAERGDWSKFSIKFPKLDGKREERAGASEREK